MQKSLSSVFCNTNLIVGQQTGWNMLATCSRYLLVWGLVREISSGDSVRWRPTQAKPQQSGHSCGVPSGPPSHTTTNYNTAQHTTLHLTRPQYCHMVWSGVMWCGRVSWGVVWCHVMWCGVVGYRAIGLPVWLVEGCVGCLAGWVVWQLRLFVGCLAGCGMVCGVSTLWCVVLYAVACSVMSCL